jgi:hypothetical protein
MTREDFLKAAKSATQSPSDAGIAMYQTGIPIYVDPVGLTEAEKAMSSLVNVSAMHQPIGKTLENVLDQLGIAYSVRDGWLMITSKESLDRPFADGPMP